MKPFHFILFLFLFFYSNSVTAQVGSKSFNLMGLSDYFISGKSKGNTYAFTMYSIKEGSNPSNPKNITFTLRPLTKEAFINNFFRSYANFQKQNPQIIPDTKGLIYNLAMSEAEKKKNANYKLLEDEATKLFYMFVAESIVYDDLGNEPIAGTIYYEDSLLVLRRDFDHHSLHSIINQLWKIYKEDKKSMKKLLKTGSYNDDLVKTTKKSKSINQINKVIKKYNDDQKKNNSTQTIPSLSGQFEFTELMATLNKRNFWKKKDKDYLLKSANDAQKNYDDSVNALNKLTVKIKTNLDSLAEFNSISNKLDSIKLIENRKRIIYKNLKDDFFQLRSFAYEISLLPEDIYKIDASFFDLLYLEQLDNNLKDFRECLYNDSTRIIKFNKENCFIQNSTVTETIKKASIVIKNKTNNHPITDSLFTFQDSMNLKVAINILERGVILKDSLYKSVERYYNNAATLNRLYKKQVEFAIEINNKSILLSLKKHNQNPLVSSSAKTVSYPSWLPEIDTEITDNSFLTELPSVPQELIVGLDNLKNQVKTDTIRINKLTKKLNASKKKQIKALAIDENQLIFNGFKVDSIVIEINEGFIENILVVGIVNESRDKYGRFKLGEDGKFVTSPRTIKFENSSPIGFSRKLDFDAIKGKKLYTRGGEHTQYEMYIEDILTIYIQQHEVGRRDYSPANQKVVLKRNEAGTAKLSVGLKKEATYRLFEAKIFSDFVGLDETAPNGLIQTEISKRINLLTNRVPFRFLRVAGLSNEWNIGILSYLEPSLTLSKIEGNNKYLALESKDRFINNQYTPLKFTSTLLLKQYENFSASATANLLLLDMPNIKSTFFVNWGFRYGRTGIQDSIRSASSGIVQVNKEAVLEYGVNTFDHSPELIWSIYADERYGFSMSWQHHWFYLRDNGFEQVANTTFFENQVVNSPKDSKQYNTFRFLTTLEQSSNNKGRLFFRYTYNWQQGFWNTGFHQAQVGYSFYLFGRPKD